MKKVYLASMLADKLRMRAVAERFERMGYAVVARWIYEPGEGYSTDPEHLREWALKDEEDVKSCDLFVVFADESVRWKGQGARHTELGIARALRKTIIVVGGQEQLFHYLPGIALVQDIEGLMRLADDLLYVAWLMER